VVITGRVAQEGRLPHRQAMSNTMEEAVKPDYPAPTVAVAAAPLAQVVLASLLVLPLERVP